MWDLFTQADKVRKLLTELIKKETLKTYLFTYSHVFDTITIPFMAEEFELEKSIVHSIVSKMIFNEELMVIFVYY